MTNVQSIVTGAVQPKISQANLNKVPIVIPSEAELLSFDSLIQPYFGQIRNLRAENERLAATRDALLPKLMSGELDVSELDL
jgi:type I restriction enzyme S subunit